MTKQRQPKFFVFLSVSILLPVMVTLLSGCPAMVAGGAATGIVLAQDRRTTGTIVEDQSIAFKAKKAMFSQLTKEDHVHVSAHSYNNNVLLVGQTPTAEQRERIESAIRKVGKVRNIYNEITIDDPSSMLTRSSDSWVTTKIKSEMLLHKEINPTHIKVVSEDGIVYLLGILQPLEENIAVDIARHTKGVKKVVKIIEPNA